MDTTSPEAVGMSSDRLTYIDQMMQRFTQNDQMPGIMTLVQRQGKVVQFGMYGSTDIAAKRPMHEDAIFRIYSMTKPITSLAIMMLFEEGLLGLNDPVADYIPAFKDTKVFVKADFDGMKLEDQHLPMTVHQLLTHTAGLSYGFHQDNPVEAMYIAARPTINDRSLTLKEGIEHLASLPLVYQPGTNWRYSMATDVLGHLVEVIADMPLADFLQERIFKPLGMVDTSFHVPADKLDRFAPTYTSLGLYEPFLATQLADVTVPTLSPSGGGGLVSTLADYLQFCNCLINGGTLDGVRIIGRKTLDWMTINHIAWDLMPLMMGNREMFGYGFGLGFRVMVNLGRADRVTSVGEYGWSGAAKTYFWIDPQEALIGLFMTQYMPPLDYPLHRRFHTVVYQAII